MIRNQNLLAFALLIFAAVAVNAAEPAETKPTGKLYELRTYWAAEGKLDALNQRFADAERKLTEKHGMTSVGYWMPLDNPEHKLIYLLSYPNLEARDAAWKAFNDDSDWQAARDKTEKDGPLLAKTEWLLLHATDFSPAIKVSAEKEPRVFELRTYTTAPGKLPALHARFRDHTIKLFEKHGMTNLAYWTVDKGQADVDSANTLVYLLAHKSKAAREASFKEFGGDADWKAAKEASEKAAGGSLTVKDGVKFVLLKPTDYSPLK